MSSMTKKHFVSLADVIRDYQLTASEPFTTEQLAALAKYCEEQNHAFNRERWLNYIANGAGINGQPNQWP